ncbi:MAG: T9SS type A sorting domain-containing protein, partial [Bacteroidota bacterium]|nr:T9SS type A sorting domain-containing protein [Bacteroidota bacterium]
PAGNFINIHLIKNNNNAVTIQLQDANGRIIRQLQTADISIKINVQRLSKGSYYVRVIDGNMIKTQKVLIQ